MKKRIVKLFAVVMIIMISIVTVNADVSEPSGKVYFRGDTMVSFIANSAFTDAEQIRVVNLLTNGNSSNVNSTNNVLCSLFGHKTTTERVTVTNHKVNPKDPRCVNYIYEVEACTRCNYSDATLVYSYSISCCPDD